MLIERLTDSLQQFHKDNPISEGDYLAWLENPVTKRLKEDLELGLLEQSSEIKSHSVDAAAVSAIEYRAERELVELVLDWIPEELEKNEP